jgi:hypothetical protein
MVGLLSIPNAVAAAEGPLAFVGVGVDHALFEGSCF